VKSHNTGPHSYLKHNFGHLNPKSTPRRWNSKELYTAHREAPNSFSSPFNSDKWSRAIADKTRYWPCWQPT